MYKPLDVVRQPLYCILVVSNPVRFKSRWKLYRDCAKHLRDAGAIVVTVECAFGEREFSLEDNANEAPLTHDGSYQSFGPTPNRPAAIMPDSRQGQTYIKVRANDTQEIWNKEVLQNIGLQHLPPDAKYVSFIDADVSFVRPDIVSETLHQLQHFDVVQMFSTACDMTPTHEPMQLYRGLVHSYVDEGWPAEAEAYYGKDSTKGIYKFHPGYAWAWRRDALSKVGSLFDVAICGAGDHHMAWSMFGKAERTFPAEVSAGYKQAVLKWQSDAVALNQNIGCVDGMLLHHWHGKKADRRYKSRWDILVSSQFDPYTDLRRDWRGLYTLTDKKPKLRDDLRAYFRARSEDSIDVEPSESHVLGHLVSKPQ